MRAAKLGALGEVIDLGEKLEAGLPEVSLIATRAWDVSSIATETKNVFDSVTGPGGFLDEFGGEFGEKNR